ncbi:YdjY domain-containing protein [Kiritimatiellaeota bacterium B1221]|nr:YdjY domain-containing protein [Kiritimatiellaeota bacterium B1221]
MQALPLLAALFTQYLTQTAPIPDKETGAASIQPVAVEIFEQVQTKIKDNDAFWSAPFVIADLENKEVTVWGQHTGMAGGEPLEFFVISERSGHDYEALMVSFAKPSDIHQALEKIGAKAGAPVSPDDQRFWPRGSRIVAEIEWQTTGTDAPRRMPIEKTALTDGKEMPRTPWVFTGSPMMDNFENEGTLIYGADLYSPNSIASTFNLQSTVFDLPYQGTKTQTYGMYMRSSTPMAPAAQPMLLHLRVATAEEVDKELDLKIHFSGPSGMVKVEGLESDDFPGLAELGAELNGREGELHYLHPGFADEVPLSQVTRLARELQLMEGHVHSIRIEPPAEGQLFYKAFVPDPRYRVRENRPSQPIELHIRKSGGESWQTTLVELVEIWTDERNPTISETKLDLDAPIDLVNYLKDPEKQKPVIFIYTTGDLQHGELMSWLNPVLEQFPIVFVYLDEE